MGRVARPCLLLLLMLLAPVAWAEEPESSDEPETSGEPETSEEPEASAEPSSTEDGNEPDVLGGEEANDEADDVSAEQDDEASAAEPATAAEEDKATGARTRSPRDVRKPRETLPGLYPENIARMGGKGVWFGTADRGYTFRVTGFVHLDGRFATTVDGSDSQAEVFWRRARITLDGRFAGNFEYRLMWDNMIDPIAPYDWHLDWRPIHEFNIRVGGFKSPFSLERRARSYALMFVERGFPTTLAPNRDMGLFFYGQSKDGFFSYDVAMVAGAHDLDVLYRFSGTPDFAGRVYFLPFRKMKSPGALKNLGFGFSWTIGDERGDPEGDRRLGFTRAMPRRSAFAGRMLFEYLGGDNPVIAYGVRDRQSVQLHWEYKQGNVMAEYTRSANRLARGLTSDGEAVDSGYVAHQAWQVIASYTFVKGDEAKFFGVKPNKPFAPAKGHWGGFTGSLRYHEIYFDQAAFPLFADPESSVSAARAVGTSWQWHLTSLLELHTDFEVTIPQGGGPGGTNMPNETAVMTRIEVRY